MKKRNIALILCLVLLFSAFAPAALALDTDTPVDDPVDPAPYLLISSIGMSLTIASDGRSDNYCTVSVMDDSYTIKITLQLQRRASGSSTWEDVSGAQWTAEGKEEVTADGAKYVVTSGYTFRDKATVRVYDSNGYLSDSTVEYSNYV